MLRVLREWVLARSAPANPLARSCVLHLLCQDAGLLYDAGRKVMAGAGCALGGAACVLAVRARVHCKLALCRAPLSKARSRVVAILCTHSQ